MSIKPTQYKHIRDLREDLDLTQEQLANYLGCSQVAYSYYELGKRDIPTDFLIKLSNYYNVSIDYLLDQSNNKKRLH
ncbi:MAG: helix-turn-helix transcriptional regulator [Agathobacter sp.]|nr:helix-turn-helix transcriptional regulator [Agathobacter sp.]